MIVIKMSEKKAKKIYKEFDKVRLNEKDEPTLIEFIEHLEMILR